MAKKAYIGVDNIARKIKKCYIGIDGLARRVKRAYIGIGGVARPCWNASGLDNYGTITPLYESRSEMAAATVGNYALFGGGVTSNTSRCSSVDAYDTSLTHVNSVSPLRENKKNIGATSIGIYALFGGGYLSEDHWYPTSCTVSNLFDAYNTSLTRSNASGHSRGRGGLAATTIGDYALFAGGYGINSSNSNGYISRVDTYNVGLTRSTTSSISKARALLSATTVGNYALFAGGETVDTDFDIVDAYDLSLTLSSAPVLSQKMTITASTSVGNYALFASSSVINVYNTSLTKSTADKLSNNRNSFSATTVGQYALFAGGNNDSNIVDVYDSSLTHTIATPLTTGRSDMTSISIGEYALFAGGYINSNSNCTNVVETYTVFS